MGLVSVNCTVSVNIHIPTEIGIYDDDRNLYIKAANYNIIKKWLAETLDDLEALTA